MVDFDLKSYTALYLKNAQEEIDLIRSLFSQNDKDVKALHRICHTLKGQSFFMGFNDIGLKALELETYFRSLLENSESIEQGKSINVDSVLDDIEKLLQIKKL